MTEKGTGENAGAVVSGHEMVVTYEPSMHGFQCEPVCHEPAGADCRLYCEAGCESWPPLTRHPDGSVTHLGSDGERHAMRPTTYCNAVEFMVNGDPAEYGDDDHQTGPFEAARFPIELRWDGVDYKWRRA